MDENYKTKIGQRIKQLRESKGYSQEMLGALIDMEAPGISKLENGKYSPSLYTLIKIMEALKVEPNDFFDYEHIMKEYELENEVLDRYRKLNVSEKQLIFRLIKYLLEQR